MKVVIPLHVTGFWYVVRSYHPLFTGSLGVGLTLDPPLIARVNSDKDCKLIVNGRCIEYPTVETARKISGLDHCVSIEATSKANLGEGYGLSAALTMAYLTINLLSNSRRFTWNYVASITHMAEVINETGYGDVIAEVYGGGLVLRTSVGPPGIGAVDVIPVPRSLRVITIPLGKLATSDMMKSYGENINIVGTEVYRKFIETPSIESFAKLAREFSLRVGMMSYELDSLLREGLNKHLNNGCVLGYFIKKRLLSIICEESCLDDVVTILGKRFNLIRVFSIARHGAMVVW